MEVKGKVALITGGGSGIGRATAIRIAKEGGAVMLVDLDEAGIEETAAAVAKAGGRAGGVKADVTDYQQMAGAFDRTLKDFGRLDILHNNAGIGLGPPGFPRSSVEQWRRVLDVDLQAVVLGCYIAAPIMERGGGGVIVNTASMAGLYPHPNDPIYGAAKAGVVWFTYALRPWRDERKIRVNCVCPGIVDTPLVQRGQAARRAAGLPSIAPGKMLEAEDIAAAVMTIVRDDGLFGCALEVRPTGRRIIETPRMPGQRG